MNIKNEAVKIAADYANLKKQEIVSAISTENNGLYEVHINTLFQSYTIFVEKSTGLVLGLNAEPTLNADGLYGVYELQQAA